MTRILFTLKVEPAFRHAFSFFAKKLDAMFINNLRAREDKVKKMK